MRINFPKKYLGTRVARALVNEFGYRNAVRILNRERKKQTHWFDENEAQWDDVKLSCGLFGWDESVYGVQFWLEINRKTYEHGNSKSQFTRTKFKPWAFLQRYRNDEPRKNITGPIS